MQNGNSSPMPLQYNTLSTPRGGTYQLVLPDGSKVWLNAASSIRYPTAFTAKQRQVEMTGEVYFEIAPRKNQPFKVKVNEMEVDVLGTHFDINAYTDESAIKTTLLTGKVKVKGGEQVRMLTAGQQVRLNRQGQLNLIRHVDVASVVAWKRGLFYFDNADLPTIMRQLSRWYDIAVVYKAGSDSGRRFNGQVFRSLNLSQVLKVLELGGIHFRLEAKKLIVLP
jgi:ferric-dicitrate binding protein FerR (iron transport regulator)